jgi:hypothetical protein
MQKNSEIMSISLVSIKTRSCLYPMLPFEFGIAESPPSLLLPKFLAAKLASSPRRDMLTLSS